MAPEESRAGLILILIVVLLLVFLFWAIIWWPTGGMMGMMGYGWWFTPSMVLFAILIVVGAYLILTSLSIPGAPLRKRDRALEILRERYARGEISREEYLKIKEELQHGSG